MEQENPRARSPRIVQCGVFEIDLAGGEVRRNGLKLHLQEQPFKILAELLTRPGQLVTREELQKQLWGVHSPADLELGLNTAIKKLRAALGDSADNPRFIETIPKHGYRLLAPIHVLERGGLGALPMPPETVLPAGETSRQGDRAVRHLALLPTALGERGLKRACYGLAALLLVLAGANILAGQIETASQHISIGPPVAKKGVSIESGAARLEEAVAVYRDALKEWTRERAPLQRVTTLNNLGTALTVLGESESESGTGRLEEAVAAFREALKERTRDREPLDWAATENDFGNALRILGERESGTGRLEEAVAAFREVLKERTREREPLDWAMTENDFGNALQVLGERESGTGRLEEAVAAFREALKERTRERAPLDWAMSFGNQGVALMLLAERTKDRMMAETALLQIELAFETSRSAGHAPLAAYFAARIPQARRTRDALKGT